MPIKKDWETDTDTHRCMSGVSQHTVGSTERDLHIGIKGIVCMISDVIDVIRLSHNEWQSKHVWGLTAHGWFYRCLNVYCWPQLTLPQVRSAHMEIPDVMDLYIWGWPTLTSSTLNLLFSHMPKQMARARSLFVHRRLTSVNYCRNTDSIHRIPLCLRVQNWSYLLRFLGFSTECWSMLMYVLSFAYYAICLVPYDMSNTGSYILFFIIRVLNMIL
jgi:hypothetical protein